MKMVKSLLLGSAAGLVAVAGAQAADLPVKAKPVQYVKICTLYGVGFYYIPGTDMCIKIGGYVRAEYGWGVNGSSVGVYNAYLSNRFTNNNWWRIRGYITADARDQTEYGTVRAYIAVGLSTNSVAGNVDNAANQFDANRAFIQWAGFTFGRAASFFDFYSGAVNSYFGFFPQSDTGDGGKEVLSYTAQFGNGWSASLGAESSRRTQIVNANFATNATGASGNLGGGSFSTAGSTAVGFGAYGGSQVPDIVANLRVDQAWGSAQIAVAAHQVFGAYYNPTITAIGTLTNGLGAFPEGSGHPDEKWGWAVSGGLKLNTPYFGQGDYFIAQANYTQGALRYVFQNPGAGNIYLQENQGSLAFGLMSDAVYGGVTALGTATDLQLTTAWNINAGYEHFWNPRWRTSLYGGYAQVDYNNQANAMICSAWGTAGAGTVFAKVQGTGVGSAAIATAGCDANWNWWWVGTRTQWNVTKDFYIGVDVAYTKISGASTSNGLSATNMINAANTNVFPRVADDQDNWQVRFRVHRDFYP
jgi:hypothetical protein